MNRIALVVATSVSANALLQKPYFDCPDLGEFSQITDPYILSRQAVILFCGNKWNICVFDHFTDQTTSQLVEKMINK